MRFGLRDEIVQSLSEIAKKFNYDFLIFGSRARGDFKNNSDIDIAVMGPVTEEDIFKIRNEIDLIDMEYMVDLVFENKVQNNELLKNIKLEGIKLWRGMKREEKI